MFSYLYVKCAHGLMGKNETQNLISKNNKHNESSFRLNKKISMTLKQSMGGSNDTTITF